jgi:hypothetical protein
MTKFPLCEAAGLSVLRNIWNDTGPRMIVSADELEAALAEAPVVYGRSGDAKEWGKQPHRDELDVYTGRLICIQPIVRDTAESLLRELAEAEAEYRRCYQTTHDGSASTGMAWDRMRKVADRARKLLEGK